MYVKLIDNNDTDFYNDLCYKCAQDTTCNTCVGKQRAKVKRIKARKEK